MTFEAVWIQGVRVAHILERRDPDCERRNGMKGLCRRRVPESLPLADPQTPRCKVCLRRHAERLEVHLYWLQRDQEMRAARLGWSEDCNGHDDPDLAPAA